MYQNLWLGKASILQDTKETIGLKWERNNNFSGTFVIKLLRG